MTWAIIYPLDTFKSFSMTDDFKNPEYKNYFDLVEKVSMEKGFKGIYNGFGVTFLRSFPVNSVLFVSYEVVKNGLGAIIH